MEKPEIKNIPLNLKSRLFLIYLRFKSFSSKIAFLGLVAIIYSEFHHHRLKLANTKPWIVTNVISGDRLLVERKGKELEIQLCGISAKSNESKEYLRSLLDRGNLVINPVEKSKEVTTAEVFVQLKPDYQQEIHPSTEMVMAGVATVFNFKNCPSKEYLAMAAAIALPRNIVDIIEILRLSWVYL